MYFRDEFLGCANFREVGLEPPAGLLQGLESAREQQTREPSCKP